MNPNIVLTEPASPSDLREAHPRATRAMGDPELKVLLRLEERALRSQYGVTSTSKEVSDVLRDAMLVAFPSFRAQIRQVASESATADGYSITYADSTKEFVFPSYVGGMLRKYVDEDYGAAGPSTTELVRE